MQNHANHAQDYQSPLWQKTMKNDVWYVWVYHPKNAKACKIMKYGHAKSCKPCTRPALLWLAQKIMENDVWYVWVYLQKTAKLCKIMQNVHEKSCKSCTRLAPLWSAKKNHEKWCMIHGGNFSISSLGTHSNLKGKANKGGKTCFPTLSHTFFFNKW